MCSACMILAQRGGQNWALLGNAALTQMNLVQLLTLIFCCQYLSDQYNTRPEEDEYSFDYFQFNFWCMIEVGMMFTTILTNIIYLFLRSFLHQKMQIKIPGMLINEDSDFLVSQQTLIGY